MTRSDLRERLLIATELLELAVADPAVLGALDHEERIRLVRAATNVVHPDADVRRMQTKVRRQRERDERRAREEALLTDTGIRRLRSRPVFTTPNVFPPEGFVQEEADEDVDEGAVGERRESVDLQHCYVCKAQVRPDPPLLRPALPAVCGAELRQALRDGRPARPGGAAHRRAREDRLPGGHQAAPLRCRADRHHPVPARLGAALRRRAGLRGLGAPAPDLRPRPAPHAERGGVLPPPDRRHDRAWTSSSTTPARRCADRRRSTGT